jgi:hypothetical protein
MRPEGPIVRSPSANPVTRDAAALRAHGTSVAHLFDEWRLAALKNDARGQMNDSH